MSERHDAGLTLLYLVRHGATEANDRVPSILQGSGLDLPLTPRGEEQARGVAELLASRPISALYSSRTLRARQTALAIAGRLRIDATSADNLHECDVGSWEGLDWLSIQRRFPEAYMRFHENPADHPNLGGESYRDVLLRARPVIDELLDRHAGEQIVVVAHNVVNRTIVADLLGIDLRRANGIPQGNGCVNLIRKQGGRTELVTLNSLLHLGAPPG
jgi:broad specificity phosphatase PhoE